MKQSGRLIHWALVLFVLNSLAAVAQATYQLRYDLSVLSVVTLGRLVVVTVALLLMLAAVKQLRVTAQIYQDHARYLRKVVLVMARKTSDHARELQAQQAVQALLAARDEQSGPATSS